MRKIIIFILLVAAAFSAIATTVEDALTQAMNLRVQGNHKAAYNILTSSALANNPVALFHAGTMQADGQGTEANVEQGLAKLKKSLALGNTMAANNIGAVYFDLAARASFKDTASCRQAIEFYELARKAPNGPASIATLALMHQNGFCVAQNLAKAIAMYEESARMGNRAAAVSLVHLYSDGKYLPVNTEKSSYWRKF